LRYSDRSDLNSDALQRHFKRLLNDFQSDIWNDTLTDFEHLGDRVPQLQPSQLREILNQRDEQFDEAEVATILQSIELICNQWIEEQQSQHQSSEGFDAIRTKLQSYFETLNLPDINTDAIEQHLHKLLDIPQTGLDVLGHSLESALDRIALPTINGFSLDDVRDRLSQFNRDTLANLLQGRDDISQRLANRLMEQVEGTRDRLLDQIETLQEKTQTQMEALKQDAQRKAAATQKAAAIAAWWLFSITLTSGVTAAIAGYLAAT
jgi:DNA-binding transcriptional MerR regulator